MLSNEQLQRKLSGVLISSHTNNYGRANRTRYVRCSYPIIHSSTRHSSRFLQRDEPAWPVAHVKLGGQVVTTGFFPSSHSGTGKDKPFPAPRDVQSLSAMMSIPTV